MTTSARWAQALCLLALPTILTLVASGCSDEPVQGARDASGTPSGAGSGAGGGGGSGATSAATALGPIDGSIEGTTRIFLGVPFAAPPVGDLRWKPPQPAAPWTEPLQANQRGPACAQLGAISPQFDSSSSEDCLTLNVWAPADATESTPVLVWIHGGTFIIGSGGEASYDGRRLSEVTGSIVVTINYRLGPLGFLGHADLRSEDPAHPSAGMYGIEDQRAALEWTRDNIAAFGGDPGNVTIFGESAGGFSVCYHLLSPKSAGLFHRAIIESGACATGRVETAADAEAHADLLAAALGCTGGDVLACMRGKTAEELLLALPASPTDIFGANGWGPNVDGWNLPDDPQALLEAGEVAAVPTLLGSNANEGALFFALGGSEIADDAAYLAAVEAVAPGHGAEIVARYPSAEYDSPVAALSEVVGDAAFVCPARRTARALAQAGSSTWLYHFTHAPSGALLGDLGAFHSSEIPFVFGNASALLPDSPAAEETPLFEAMSGYWGRMARSGDPNGDGASTWPAYSAAADENIVLAMPIAEQSGLKKDTCDFWDGLGP